MKSIKLLLALILLANALKANNLQISNIAVNQTTQIVSFNVTWDNSWRVTSAPNNWDAVWLFVKFKNCGTTTATAYTHGLLSSVTADHSYTNAEAMKSVDWDGTTGISESVAQGISLDFTEGIMLRRNSVGSGSFSSTVSLKITNMPALGTDITTNVYGLEMVYVPQNNFYLGDGDALGGGANYRFGTTTAVSTSLPSTITSLYETATSTFNTTLGSTVSGIPAAWPKGQYGFYVMKYEITEGAYAEFLNTIGSTAATARYPGNYGATRNQLNQSGAIYTAFRPDRAQNYLGWGDVSAFLDWSCLRPITETEYEKACRGIVVPVTGEYSWGNVTISQGATFSGGENGTETFTGGNCNYGNGTFVGGDASNGPSRAGIFATNSSDRTSAGAAYYGAMEMTGNVQEYVIGLNFTTAAANTFKRVWGNGVVDITTGLHNVTLWPIGTYSGAGGSNANLVGARGGSYADGVAQLRLSERYYIYFSATARGASYGGRGGR